MGKGMKTDTPTDLFYRIIYELMTGTKIPGELMIDHIDGDGATSSQNMGNRRRTKSRIDDLPKGVSRVTGQKTYQARLTKKYLGCFKTIDAAKSAYNKAATDYYGEFAKHG